jgi:hypothetical protein
MSQSNRRNRHSVDSDRFVTDRESIREEDENSFRGLLLGILLALLCGGGLTALFLLNKNEEAPTVISPVPSSTPSSSAQPTSRETTIIRENTREVVPVPQATSKQPDINITVPDSQPSVVQPPESKTPSADKTPQTPTTREGVPETDTILTPPSPSPQAQ